MIAPGAHISVQRLPLSRIVVTMCERRSMPRLESYRDRLVRQPHHDVLIHVQPLGHGYYGILDGHHRYLASVAAGRLDVLAVIVDETAASEE